MRLEDGRRNEVEILKRHEAELLEQNAQLQRQLVQAQERQSTARPSLEAVVYQTSNAAETLLGFPSSDSEMPSPASTSSAIDLAFPPLLPVSAPRVYSRIESANAQTSLSQMLSRSSTPSSSSSFDLPTPTSPSNPLIIPLPDTPPSEDVDESGEQPPRAPAPQLGDRLDGPIDRRGADIIFRELAETQAETDAHDREIAELQEAIANLQHIVQTGRSDSGGEH